MGVSTTNGSTGSQSALPADGSVTDPGPSPEQRLMAAVLKQALDDLRLVRGYRGKTHLSEVEEWFGDHERGSYLDGFWDRALAAIKTAAEKETDS